MADLAEKAGEVCADVAFYIEGFWTWFCFY
jgi:hypothetical protein